MSGTLYVVATPIGNLEDISFRALRVLREVSLIAAEDTRRTAKLLQHYSILTPTTSFHTHNEKRKQALLLNKLNNDQAIALVSDAGTPTISDPGALIVAAATEAGIRVEVIPGPSAVITAISASGLLNGAFTFVGFSPSRLKDRIPWLNELKNDERAIVFFESPHRIRTTLEQMQHIMSDRDSGAQLLDGKRSEYYGHSNANCEMDLRKSVLPAGEKNWTNGEKCKIPNHEYLTGGFSTIFKVDSNTNRICSNAGNPSGTVDL